MAKSTVDSLLLLKRQEGVITMQQHAMLRAPNDTAFDFSYAILIDA